MILPSYFFGDISYYAFIIQNENVIIDLHEKYIKQTQRNHTKILGPNGVQKISVPVSFSSSEKTTTGSVSIEMKRSEAKGHLQSIATAYGSAPFFSSLMPLIEIIFKTEHKYLGQLNKAAFKLCSLILEIEHIPFSEKYLTNDENYIDYREATLQPSIDIGFPEYPQIFDDKHGFQSNLSILDLLFNEGRWARNYLMELSLPSL